MLLFLLLAAVQAALVQESVIRGSHVTYFTYDSANPGALNWMLTGIGAQGEMYVTGVTGGSAPQVACRETLTTPIIVAPKGCDANDESQAVLRANCGQKTLRGLLDYWTYARHEVACLLGGAEATCLGPPHLAKTGLPDDGLNDFDLLEGVYVRSGVGPDCAVPAVTRVAVVMPSLAVESTCARPLPGNYTASVRAQQRTEFTFSNLATDIILAPISAGLWNLTCVLNGVTLFSSPVATGVSTVVNGTCTLRFTITPAPRPLQLLPISIPSGSDYFKVTTQTPNYVTRACGYGVAPRGFESPRSVVQGVPEGVPYGGYPVFTTPEGVPLQLDPDPRFADFDDNCDRFYPPAETFRGFGFSGYDGQLYDRSVPAQNLCYAPYPHVELLLEVDTREARAKQCHMLGGAMATATGDVCTMSSTRTLCRKGFIYFDNRCYYKFDETREAAFKVPAGADSDRVCAQLNPNAISSSSITYTQSAWLQRFFVYWRYPATSTRNVLVGRQCECYTGTVGVVSCDCGDPNFPLCSYHVKDVSIPWASVDYHPSALWTLRDGQVGVQSAGRELRCACLVGSSGPDCSTRTCPSPTEIAGSVNASLDNSLIRFFKRCYTGGRGACHDNDPNQCECAPGFGPPANLLAGLHEDTPCMCPAGADQGMFDIEIDELTSNSSSRVCGGVKHGSCELFGWNRARCNCTRRWSREPQGTEPDYGGAACTCAMPDFQQGFDVVETLCNDHGTCCPAGERADGGLGDCAGVRDGCKCDAGRTGLACTSAVPRPTKSSVFSGWATPPSDAYISFQYPQPVTKVYALGATTQVGFSLDGEALVNCTLQRSDEWELSYGSKWSCNATQAKFVWALGPRPARITLTAHAEDFGPCGHHPSPYAARFMAVPEFRSPGKYQKVQPWKFAQFGSTTSHCMCNPGWMGSECGIGISSYRVEESTAVLLPQMCGESTQPARGLAVGQRCECAWIGDLIAFTGDSCECAVVDGQMCGGVGVCVTAKFPRGACQADLTAWEQDALWKPYRDDCSDPTFRALVGCPEQPITAYSNTLGLGYGIFHNLIPGVDFSGEWGPRPYQMLHSLFGGFRCDEFGEEAWDNYLTTVDPAWRSTLVSQGLFSTPLICSNITLDVNNTTDQAYLRTLHAATMSRRRCTADSECEQFTLGENRCVYDSDEHIPWRGGDPAKPVESTFGEEGGCECGLQAEGFYDAATFCSSCAPGYGPDTAWESQRMVLFADRLGLPWVDGGVHVARCSLPTDSQSSRLSSVCGGRAFVRRGPVTNRTIPMVSYAGTRKRCETLTVGNTTYTLVQGDVTRADLQLYTSPTGTLDVVAGRLFSRGVPVEAWTCVEDAQQGPRERRVWSQAGKIVLPRVSGDFTLLW